LRQQRNNNAATMGQQRNNPPTKKGGAAGFSPPEGTSTDTLATMTTADIHYLNPAGTASPGGHYSHATVANGFVFVSGQLPITPVGEKLSAAPFEEQARQALANVKAALEAAGSSVGRLVQVRVYLDSLESWPAFNAVYADWIGAVRPSRAVVPTGPLHYGLRVEVEAVGLVGASATRPLR
jgi:reactive intermediate/imine deaminase